MSNLKKSLLKCILGVGIQEWREYDYDQKLNAMKEYNLKVSGKDISMVDTMVENIYVENISSNEDDASNQGIITGTTDDGSANENEAEKNEDIVDESEQKSDESTEEPSNESEVIQESETDESAPQ